MSEARWFPQCGSHGASHSQAGFWASWSGREDEVMAAVNVGSDSCFFTPFPPLLLSPANCRASNRGSARVHSAPPGRPARGGRAEGTKGKAAGLASSSLTPAPAVGTVEVTGMLWKLEARPGQQPRNWEAGEPGSRSRDLPSALPAGPSSHQPSFPGRLKSRREARPWRPLLPRPWGRTGFHLFFFFFVPFLL